MARGDKKPRVAVDSGLVISHVIGDLPQHANGIQSLFHEVDSDKVLLYGSTLLLTEVLGGGFREPPDSAKENQILGLLANPNVITLAQVTRQVAMTARDFRRKFHLKSPDAIHLATAVFVGADAFMTTDEDDFPHRRHRERREDPRTRLGARCRRAAARELTASTHTASLVDNSCLGVCRYSATDGAPVRRRRQ